MPSSLTTTLMALAFVLIASGIPEAGIAFAGMATGWEVVLFAVSGKTDEDAPRP